MKTIISNSAYKVFELFNDNLDKKIHLREICRRTKLNENSVSKILNKFIEKDLLSFEKKGNMNEYYLKSNMITSSLLSIFDSEKFEKLPKSRKNAINLFLNELDEKPIIVLLFGSTAKNNFSEKSDIDLFLVVNRKINTLKAKEYSESQTGININDFQINVKNFEDELKLKKDKMLQSAMNSGYPIQNSELFYHLVLK
jgi:predicted nucleotidyltransferase